MGFNTIATYGTERHVDEAFRLLSEGEFVCGECKWTSSPVGADVVETLEERARSVTDRPTSIQLLVFSKSGFADSARREADHAGNVRLVFVDELFESHNHHRYELALLQILWLF